MLLFSMFLLILTPDALKRIAFLWMCFPKYFVTFTVLDLGCANSPAMKLGLVQTISNPENFGNVSCIVLVLQTRKGSF